MRSSLVIVAPLALAIPALASVATNSTRDGWESYYRYVCNPGIRFKENLWAWIDRENGPTKREEIFDYGVLIAVTALCVINLHVPGARPSKRFRACAAFVGPLLVAQYVALSIVPELFEPPSDESSARRREMTRFAMTIWMTHHESWELSAWLYHGLRWVQEVGLVYDLVTAMSMAPPRPNLYGVVAAGTNLAHMLGTDLGYLRRWWEARG
ncbi:uncharacterized protein B0H64DRAFT_469364 [Chaetomium fimeti]|uniref:Uncharacterized protein n=1 Tax=Chaetomium fimeti TaxID=1854472 RepID=A0AAE0H839_9PEZI|nr:hypothetical protein B0H64DRAFT_469364 [Chaetomium fimeti]